MNCPECNSEDIVNGTCRNCGFVVDETPVMMPPIRDYDHPESFQYGNPRTHNIPDMSLMTYTDPRDRCDSLDLKRALKMDGYFGWDIEKTIILNNEMREIIEKLNLDKQLLSQCYYFLRKNRNKGFLRGKQLDYVAPSLVYLLVRLFDRSYSLLDFELIGYDTKKIFNYYQNFVKDLNLYDDIKPQDPLIFVEKYMKNILFSNTEIDTSQTLNMYIKETKKIFNEIAKDLGTKYSDLNMSPLSIYSLGTCIYIAHKHLAIGEMWFLSKERIAGNVGCSTVTIDNYMRKFAKLYGIE